MNKPGRNDLCPCGSNKKFKKCCTLTILQNRAFLNWLKINDTEPPIDYNTVTKEELDDNYTTNVFAERCQEILSDAELAKAEKFIETGHV